MKYSFFGLLTILSLVTLTFAAGTSANLVWVMPTAYNDGTAVPLADIAFTTITWTPKIAGGKISGSQQVKAPATSVSIPGLTCGDFNFTASVTTTATALYPNGVSPTVGPVLYTTGLACAPNPPTALVAH